MPLVEAGMDAETGRSVFRRAKAVPSLAKKPKDCLYYICRAQTEENRTTEENGASGLRGPLATATGGIGAGRMRCD